MTYNTSVNATKKKNAHKIHDLNGWKISNILSFRGDPLKRTLNFLKIATEKI